MVTYLNVPTSSATFKNVTLAQKQYFHGILHKSFVIFLENIRYTTTTTTTKTIEYITTHNISILHILRTVIVTHNAFFLSVCDQPAQDGARVDPARRLLLVVVVIAVRLLAGRLRVLRGARPRLPLQRSRGSLSWSRTALGPLRHRPVLRVALTTPLTTVIPRHRLQTSTGSPEGSPRRTGRTARHCARSAAEGDPRSPPPAPRPGPA